MASEEGMISKVSSAPHSMNKESPLTDIATSPPPFDFGVGIRDSESDHGDKKRNGRVVSERDGTRASAGRKDSYESSELSDLGEDESEAETDKMDFLDDDDETSKDKILDLQALSKLTELARLKEVDSDEDDEHEDEPAIITKPVPEKSPEPLELAGSPSKSALEQPEPSKSPSPSKRKLEDVESSIEKKTKLANNDENKEVDVDGGEDIDKNGGEVKEEDKEEIKDGAKSFLNEQENQILIEEKKHEVDVNHSSEEELNNETDSGNLDPQNDVHVDDDDINGEEEDNEREEEDEEEEEEEEEEPENTEDAEISKLQEDNDVDMNEERKLAIEELISIEALFAELRDKLYQDKLNLLERELQLCLEGSHPELSKIYYKINGFYQEGVKLANSNLSYSLKCINTETIATRTSIHQNFLKNIMDFKNDMISETTSLWYKINKERNQLDQLAPDFNFSAIPLIPNYTVNTTIPEVLGSENEPMPLTKKAMKQNTLIELVQQRNNINHELGILNGLMQFYGFPSATSLAEVDKTIPNATDLILRKATEDEINEDLESMGIFT